jgi:hypothetical protein
MEGGMIVPITAGDETIYVDWFRVIFGFHPIPLGVWGRGRKEKNGKRERLWEIKHIFFALLNPLYIDLLPVVVLSC